MKAFALIRVSFILAHVIVAQFGAERLMHMVKDCE
jgi:hypothetical protein